MNHFIEPSLQDLKETGSVVSMTDDTSAGINQRVMSTYSHIRYQ